MKTFNNISQAIARLPPKIGAAAVNFSKSRFVKQNWHDESPEPWKPRSTRRRGSNLRQKGAILVDSGRLKRSIRLASVSQDRIIIATDVPYAQVHNDGLNGTVNVRSHSRHSRTGRTHTVKVHSRTVKLPQRRFLGESAELSRQIQNLIIREIKTSVET